MTICRTTVGAPPSFLPAPALECDTAMTLSNPENGHRGRVLFMDDEDGIRDLVGIMLERQGFAVTLVGDGREAATAYEDAIAGNAPYDVVVLDLSVPGGPGAIEAIEILRGLDPSVRALVSSGDARDPAMVEPAAFGFAGVVPKPYEIDELAVALERAMSFSDPARNAGRR